MGRQTASEKSALTSLMDEIRARSGKRIPQLLRDIENLGYTNTISYNTLQNDFFNRPRRSSTYDSELVLSIIEIYYHFVDRQSLYHPADGNSITLLEAAFILAWTHASLADYWRLCDIFGVNEYVIKYTLSYILDLERHNLNWVEHAAEINQYFENVANGGPLRPWGLDQ